MSALSSSLPASSLCAKRAVGRNAAGAGERTSPFKGVLATLRQWRQRSRSRCELAQLSAVELRDIGYPAEAKAEIAKPFWRK
jgi:uncharacterized protein YjiS (DUF1127 family)